MDRLFFGSGLRSFRIFLVAYFVSPKKILMRCSYFAKNNLFHQFGERVLHE